MYICAYDMHRMRIWRTHTLDVTARVLFHASSLKQAVLAYQPWNTDHHMDPHLAGTATILNPTVRNPNCGPSPNSSPNCNAQQTLTLMPSQAQPWLCNVLLNLNPNPNPNPNLLMSPGYNKNRTPTLIVTLTHP